MRRLAYSFIQHPDRCRYILSRWPQLLLENALHHARAEAKFPADLENAVAAGLQFENLRFQPGSTRRRPSFVLSPSRAPPRDGAYDHRDHPAFGIGQHPILARTPAGNVLWDCLDPYLRMLALADVCSSG
jgi:hypothetical protein